MPKESRGMMLHINFNQPNQKIHFIGIGGISMSGLAEILLQRKFHVSGSDMKASSITEHLQKLGVPIFIGHCAENIPAHVDLVVYTAAVKEDNPELQEALSKKIPTMDRAALLGQIMKHYPYAVAVAGTHGKTTTTSMLSHILLAGSMDPTITVGGILEVIGGNIRTGSSDYFITEACEYCNSFLKFFPYIGIVLNIEEDHLDYFKDIDEIRTSFTRFAQLIPPQGALLINGDTENLHQIVEHLTCRVITFGTNPDTVMWAAANIQYNKKGSGSFDILFQGKNLGRIILQVPGIHNIYNSLAAFAAAYDLGVSAQDCIQGLYNFGGTQRRFEYKGMYDGITIIDDYAHHPTEIKATLKAAQRYPHQQLWCVFQPHTYTRTKAFLQDFAHSFGDADIILITDIYAAREKDPGDIHAKDLAAAIQKLGKKVYYFSSFEEVQAYLKKHCFKGDLLITMGAGDVNLIGEALLQSDLSTVSTDLSPILATSCCE